LAKPMAWLGGLKYRGAAGLRKKKKGGLDTTRRKDKRTGEFTYVVEGNRPKFSKLKEQPVREGVGRSRRGEKTGETEPLGAEEGSRNTKGKKRSYFHTLMLMSRKFID